MLDGNDLKRVHFVGIKYTYADLPVAYTAGSKFVHLFRLLCQFSNSMSVSYLNPSENPFSTNVQQQDPNSAAADTLCQLTRLRKVRLGASDKINFLEFYRKQQ